MCVIDGKSRNYVVFVWSIIKIVDDVNAMNAVMLLFDSVVVYAFTVGSPPCCRSLTLMCSNMIVQDAKVMTLCTVRVYFNVEKTFQDTL